MKLKLVRLLSRLGELKRADPPSRHEVAAGAGIALATVTKIFSIPHTRISGRECEGLTSYLFSQFRPHVHAAVSDSELLNRLRFELIEFEGERDHTAGSDSCPFSPDGVVSLEELFPSA